MVPDAPAGRREFHGGGGGVGDDAIKKAKETVLQDTMCAANDAVLAASGAANAVAAGLLEAAAAVGGAVVVGDEGAVARKPLRGDSAPQLATGMVAEAEAGATQVNREWSVVVNIVFASRWFTSNPMITFCVPAGVNVSYLKNLLEAREGIPAKDQRWFFSANELENNLVVGPTGIDEPDRPWFLGESGFKVVNVVLDQSWNYELVLAMGTVKCLGIGSSLRILDTDCLKIICQTLGSNDLDIHPRPPSHDAFADTFDCDGGGGGDDAIKETKEKTTKNADSAADDASPAPPPATSPFFAPAPAPAPAAAGSALAINYHDAASLQYTSKHSTEETLKNFEQEAAIVVDGKQCVVDAATAAAPAAPRATSQLSSPAPQQKGLLPAAGDMAALPEDTRKAFAANAASDGGELSGAAAADAAQAAAGLSRLQSPGGARSSPSPGGSLPPPAAAAAAADAAAASMAAAAASVEASERAAQAMADGLDAR
jgi:hypothetical protein